MLLRNVAYVLNMYCTSGFFFSAFSNIDVSFSVENLVTELDLVLYREYDNYYIRTTVFVYSLCTATFEHGYF
jgi:hypothetical protein